MTKKITFLLAFLFPLITFAQHHISIIPQPVSLQLADGSLVIDGKTASGLKMRKKS